MKVNLRKAQKIRKSIEVALAGFPLVTTVGIDVDDASSASDPAARINVGRAELKLQLNQHKALSATLARLRINIAKKNLEVGIDEMLARSADIDRSIKLLSAISQPSRDTIEAIPTKIKRLQTTLERSNEDPHMSYHGAKSSILTVNVVDQELADEVGSVIIDLRRTKEQLEDLRLELNGNTLIEIGEDDADVLRDMKII